MSVCLLWSIGARNGRSPDLVDTYETPGLLGVARDQPAGADCG